MIIFIKCHTSIIFSEIAYIHKEELHINNDNNNKNDIINKNYNTNLYREVLDLR